MNSEFWMREKNETKYYSRKIVQVCIENHPSLYAFIKEKKEFVLSKQILRGGTGIGAIVQEGIRGESKADFIHKFFNGQ